MSDTSATEPTISIPLKPLERKDEQGNLVAAITPVILYIQRGDLKGNPYPGIKVTKENLNDYVKFRTVEDVLATINATENQRAQGALNYVLDKTYPNNSDGESEAWTEASPDPDTKKPRWSLVIDKFVAVIDDFWKTLTEGKVRSGETIESLEEDKKSFLEEMNAALQSLKTIKDPVKVQQVMLEATELSTKYQECDAKIDEIRKSRTPRKTKAQKLAEQAAALAKAGQSASAAQG